MVGGAEAARPAGVEAEKSVEGGAETGGPRREQPVAGGGSVAEAERMLEEVLSLYSDLLKEMERLKQRLGEKLS
jgi:hypothetical protein